ncbi:hypothetical protein SRS16P3_00049 (plasmid) [Variovorax sp. SRS16]|nr:hypothetical protein SRS16P3_00049 [Variovorax sp. SRS16]
MWIGTLLVALAVCPIACAESNHASNVRPLARPAIHAVEPSAAAASPQPEVGVAADLGGAIYNPFAQTSRSDDQVPAANVRSTHTDDPSPIAAILTALGCLAAFGYLLRRMLNGF